MAAMQFQYFICLLLTFSVAAENYEYGGECPHISSDLAHARTVLGNMNDGILETLCGDHGTWNCTKIVVYSEGESSLKQPTSFGLYFLYGLTGGNSYPSFHRPAGDMYLFFRTELGEWEYWHQYERWVIGPIHNKAVGGIMIKPYNPEKKCPWHTKWFRSNSWFYDVKRQNRWNPEGNPWVLDNTIRVDCYSEERWPAFNCNCNRINVTNNGRVLEYHPDTLGEYVRLPNMEKEGYLAPVFGKVSPGAPSYLYSHDVEGNIWLMGSSTHSWSLRFNLLPSPAVPECPFYPRPAVEETDYYDEDDSASDKGPVWEYLQTKRGDHEVWLKDYTLEVKCIEAADPL